MTQNHFAVEFPETVDGETLVDLFQAYAREGTGSRFTVTSTPSYDLQEAEDLVEDNEELQDVMERLESDRQEREALRHIAEKKDLTVHEVHIRTKRTSSLKDVFFPLRADLTIDPGEEYDMIVTDVRREYSDDDLEEFEDFAEQVYDDLGLETGAGVAGLNTDDVPLARQPWGLSAHGTKGRSFLAYAPER